MEYLKIKNWDKWQTYRSDRGQPPWIKIHRRLMRNVEWVSLSDAERGQLVAIWLLGADHNGVIPASPEIIKKLCFMSEPLNISKFKKLGFIENGWRQSDAKVTPTCHTKSRSRSRGDKSKEDTKSSNPPPYEQIISDLNDVTSRSFSLKCEKTKTLIKSRWREGYRLEDFKYVHRVKFREWSKDVKMTKFLRPETLYGTKFDGYRNQPEPHPLTGEVSDITIENLERTEGWENEK